MFENARVRRAKEHPLKTLSLFACCVAVVAGATSSAVFAAGISDETLKKIAAKADAIYPELVGIREQIHMHPELSGKEKETSALVEKRLKELGYEVRAGVGGYGVIGVMKGGGGPGPVVAYRADMDAMPMGAIGNQAYKSQVPGVNHVCGHDVHVAVGLGIAEVFASLRESFPGTVKFIFQPAEENATGARKMVEDHALENPRPDVIYAAHTGPFEAGRIGSGPGVGLASQQGFHVTLEGAPEAVKTTAAKIAAALNAASTVKPLASPADIERVMKSLGQSPYGDFMWIMARTAAAGEGLRVDGQVRTPSDELDARAKKSVEETIAKAAAEGGVKASTQFDPVRLPAMISEPGLTKAAEPIIARVIGGENIVHLTATEPYFGEDFSVFNREVPGAFFFIGVANTAKGIRAYNHLPDYDADEEGIRVGTKTMSAVIYDTLLRPAVGKR